MMSPGRPDWSREALLSPQTDFRQLADERDAGPWPFAPGRRVHAGKPAIAQKTSRERMPPFISSPPLQKIRVQATGAGHSIAGLMPMITSPCRDELSARLLPTGQRAPIAFRRNTTILSFYGKFHRGPMLVGWHTACLIIFASQKSIRDHRAVRGSPRPPERCQSAPQSFFFHRRHVD